MRALMGWFMLFLSMARGGHDTTGSIFSLTVLTSLSLRGGPGALASAVLIK